MKRALQLLATGTALVFGAACGDFEVPNYSAQSITELQSGANAAQVGAAVVGVMGISREFETSFLQSHISLTGTFGREGMELDPSNPQHPIDRLDQIGTGEPSYAGWSAGYRLIKQGNVILAALATATGLTGAQKDGVRGVTKTMQALALIRLLNVFDQSGMPIDVDIKTSDPAAPIATKAAVQSRIVQLLDEAQTHLQAAGSAFSFTLPPGFTTAATQGTGFNTPATFLTFNRALKARIEVYRGSIAEVAAAGTGATNYTAALTALGASFLSTTASLRFGAYDTYSTRSGDRTNPLFDPTCRQLFAQPELEAGAQTNGTTIDNRFTTKIQKITAKVNHGYTVNSCWKLYPTSDTPIPIIRNEELILLRAEARWFTGDKAGAIQDIDFIRTTAGGLQPAATIGLTPASTDAAFIDELLYNRLYSLMWEGGHRWVDTRRFNRLASLPKEKTTNKIFPYLALPEDECLPRSNPPASCTNPTGI
ncbi:MAG: RagB/SusD family nutrient uptake outer membrane protein [Gemmatimonadetes bacterium]|nr:RagB/SusD family nutrient uptake outer membrane protein [Gemmatimonadota bacterium]